MYLFNKSRLLRQVSLLVCSLLGASPLLWAQENVEIANVWRVNNYLRAEGGKTAFGNKDDNAVWEVEKIPNNTAVRLKHVASGLYLHAETDGKIPALGNIKPEWMSAMWVLEPVAGTTDQVRIKNGWRGVYLHTESSGLEMGAAAPGWLSARWKVKALPIEVVLGTSGGSATFADQLSVASKEVIWRVNTAGYVMKSADAGTSWTLLDKKLASVSAESDKLAWGLTFEDKLEYTADGGATWTPLSGEFKQLSVVDANVLWAVNQELGIFRSTDGGRNWEKVTGAGQSISAVSATVAWAVNQGNVWKTNDGGKTWSFSVGKMKSVSAYNVNVAWGLDESGTLKCTRDGKTWYKVAEGYFHSCHSFSDYNAYVIDKNLHLRNMSYYGEEKMAIQAATPTPAEEKKEKLTGDKTLDALLQGEKAGEKSTTYGYLSVFNQGGYVASIALAYTDGTGNVVKNEQVALGSTKQYQIPIDAKNIVMKVEGVSCVDPLGMEVKFATAKDLQKCYKLWGTIFGTEWGGIPCN